MYFKKAMQIEDVVAVLLNDGFIVRRQPYVFGQTKYFVMLPGGKNPDIKVGYITDCLACKLWDAGWLVGDPNTKRDDSYIYTVFSFCKPKLSFLESSGGNQE